MLGLREIRGSACHSTQYKYWQFKEQFFVPTLFQVTTQPLDSSLTRKYHDRTFPHLETVVGINWKSQNIDNVKGSIYRSYSTLLQIWPLMWSTTASLLINVSSEHCCKIVWLKSSLHDKSILSIQGSSSSHVSCQEWHDLINLSVETFT